jgi:hypothetical protein
MSSVLLKNKYDYFLDFLFLLPLFEAGAAVDA